MKKGFSLIELLIAIAVASITLTAFTAMFIVGNRTLKTNREISNSVEEIRNVITTLEFVFSRWGFGVPCRNNNCTITNPGPCDGYPPSNPLCMNSGSNVEFYASLEGFGFITGIFSSDPYKVNVIGCRLSSSETQNYYHVWRNFRIQAPDGTTSDCGSSLNDCIFNISQVGENHCLYDNLIFPSDVTDLKAEVGNLSTDGKLKSILDNKKIITLIPGDILIRVPHRIRLRLDQNRNWLYMDRVDMVNNQQENSVIIATKVRSFYVSPVAYGARVDITFLLESERGGTREYRITRYFGR